MAKNPASKKNDETDGGLMAHFLHGGMSSFLSTLPTLIIFPVYKTIFRQQIHNSSIRQAVSQLRKEGLLRLYRGVAPPLLQRTLNGTLLFGVHGTIHHQLTLSSQKVFPSSALPALAGLPTGVVEAVCLTPLERVQNLLQNSQNDKNLPRLKSVLVEMSARINHPASGYYRGFLPIAVRNALGSMLYFGLKGPIYDTMHAQGLPRLVASFSSGMLASCPIAFAVYPMSVLVANMQKNLEGDVRGPTACWRMLWAERQGSLRQLYRGGSLVILRSCISWGITTALFDYQQRLRADCGPRPSIQK